MANQPEKRILMDIERRLQADCSGSFKESVRAGILQQIENVDATLKQGLAPEDYRRLATLKKGLQAALEILHRTWHYYH